MRQNDLEVAANSGLGLRLPMQNLATRMRLIMLLLLLIADLAALPGLAKAQSLADSEDSSGTGLSTTPAQLDLTYTRPTHTTKFRNYIFDVLGPYPVVGAAFAAGISQANNTPPEWRQGTEGYAKRFVSDFGIAAVSTTTRYALAEALKEDTLYYRCECKGVVPRLSHAVTSTLIARRGVEGHRVFSLPALIAPYAGHDDRPSMVGTPAATTPRMLSGWATTLCWDPWAGTSPESFSRADPTPGFPSCI